MGRTVGHEEKRGFWQEHFRLWEESGRSQIEYCREKGLSKSSFHYWRSKLSAGEGPTSLVEITKVFKGLQTPLRLQIDHRYSIEIERGFCAETLERLLGVLEGR